MRAGPGGKRPGVNAAGEIELPDRDAVERAYQRDIAWAAGELGSPVVSASPVSPLRGRGRPLGAFRLELSDARLIKLRRMPDAERAEELERLLGTLAALGFPRVLARRGRLLILEWIPGAPFAAEPETPARIVQAAQLLGSIHRTPSFAGQRLPDERPSTTERDRFDQQLSALVRAGRLTERQVDSFRRIARERIPARALHGFTHGDFAPENLVLDASGAVRVVDNEAVQLGILDLDLARVWSRWPMPPASWGRFLVAYGSASGRSCRDDDLAGWKLRTLVVSAWYRSAFRLEGADAAVAKLCQFGNSLR